MMRSKKVTIHKANEIIRGVDDYSLFAKRCMNAIFYIYQYNYNKNKSIQNMQTIDIEFSFLKKMMNLEKNESYITIIENALKELEKTIELNHFYHPLEKIRYVWYTDRFLNRAGYVIENNRKYARIEISQLAKYLMTKQSNFTKIDIIHNVNKLRTKYAMKLYEYLKSFSRYRYLDISQKHLMKLFAIDEDNKTYKHYANLKQLLERQINEIAKKTDLTDVKLVESKDLAKKKIFRIIINQKSKKSVDKIEAKLALDSLIKRF
jgi:L-rhamnose mutarotase